MGARKEAKKLHHEFKLHTMIGWLLNFSHWEYNVLLHTNKKPQEHQNETGYKRPVVDHRTPFNQ